MKTITYVKTFADLIDVSLMYGFEDYLRKNTDKYGNAALDLYSLISIGLTVHDPIEELFKESIKPSTAIFTAWESFKTTNTYNAMILEDENTVIKFDAMMKLLKDVK